MQVKDLMSKNPIYISPTTTLKEAGEKMLKSHCGFMPIGDGDRLLGAVTDRDITIRGTAKGKDPNKTEVQEVMTKTILYCFEDDDVTHVAKNMGENHVHRLAVLDKNKRLTGIISFGDIALKCQDARLCGQLAATLSADITERIH